MTEWVVLNLDAKQAKQHGMPEKVPMPKEQFEAVGIQGLTHETALKWINQFLTAAGPTLRQKEPATAKRYEAYISKMKFWQDAQAAFSRRDLPKAASLLQLVCNVDKEDYAAKQNLATVHAAMGNHEAALKVFREISDVWSGSSEYHVAFANTLLTAGLRDEAIEQFVTALEADGENRAALDGLVTLGLLVKVYEEPLDPKSLTFIRRDALLDYLTGTWDKEDKPLDFLLRVGAYHESERRYDVSLSAADRALALSPTAEAAHLLRASALSHLGRKGEAAEVLETLAAANPASASACAERAALAYGSGESEVGEKWARAALAIDPGHLSALHLHFFRTLDPPALEQVADAIASVETHAWAHPQIAGPQRLMGRLFLSMNNQEKALAAFVRATELAQNDDEVLSEYLNALLKYGAFQRVIDVISALGDRASGDWRIRWSEADAYLGLGRKMEARAAFTALNADESLHVSVRARAKRAVESMVG